MPLEVSAVLGSYLALDWRNPLKCVIFDHIVSAFKIKENNIVILSSLTLSGSDDVHMRFLVACDSCRQEEFLYSFEKKADTYLYHISTLS